MPSIEYASYIYVYHVINKNLIMTYTILNLHAKNHTVKSIKIWRQIVFKNKCMDEHKIIIVRNTFFNSVNILKTVALGAFSISIAIMKIWLFFPALRNTTQPTKCSDVVWKNRIIKVSHKILCNYFQVIMVILNLLNCNNDDIGYFILNISQFISKEFKKYGRVAQITIQIFQNVFF